MNTVVRAPRPLIQRLKQRLSLGVLLCAVGLAPAQLRGAVMAYEGFDYPTGTGNLNGNSGGTGWNGGWQRINNGSHDIVAGNLVADGNALAGYDTRSIGNHVNLPNGRRDGRALDTSAAGPFGSRGYCDAFGRIGASGKTLYISFMQQPNGTSVYYEFELHRDNLGDPGRIAGIGNDQPGDNVNLRAPNGTHTLIGPGTTAVNFYVVRIDFKEGDDDVFVYMNPTSETEPAAPTLTRLAATDMSFNGIALGAFANNRTVAHDEIRIGETWADVTFSPLAPSVLTHPQSSTNFAGGTAQLVAAVDGAPAPALRWYKDEALLTGQTGTALTLSNLKLSDAGSYWMVAINAYGMATSAVARITLREVPSDLLAYEPFEYLPSTNALIGQAGGVGWNGPWIQIHVGGGPVEVLADNLVAGLRAPNGYDAKSLGNRVRMTEFHRDGRFLNTSADGPFAAYRDANGRIGADNTTVFISFQQQVNKTDIFYAFELKRDDLGDGGGILYVGHDGGATDGGVEVRAFRNSALQASLGTGDTEVNFYVIQIDFKPGNDDIHVFRNVASRVYPGTAGATAHLLGVGDFSFNGISMAAFLNGVQVSHDEVRVGASWNAVIGSLPNADAPSITRQPVSQGIDAGRDVSLAVQVAGSAPFAFQWYRDNTLIPNATNALLMLPNAQPAASGAYQVVITNSLGSVTSAVASIFVYAAENNLVSRWRFDEFTGLSAFDATANHLDGSLIGFPVDDSQWQFGIIDGGLTLNGNSRVQLDSHPAPNLDSFTVAFWMQLNAAVTENLNILARERISDCPSWGLEIGAGNILNFFLFGTNGPADVKASVPLELGLFYHVACRFSSTNLMPDIFLNGALVSTNRGNYGLNGPPAYDQGVLMMGGSRKGGCANANSVNGLIDDVQLYNKALSVAEVTFIANNPGEVLDPVLLSPVISQHPVNQEVSEGGTASFTVAADGSAPLYYHWLKDGAPIGAPTTNATLQLPNLKPTDAAAYSVVVSNFLGTSLSSAATLTVVSDVRITEQPKNLVVPVGGSGAFSVAIKGAPPISYKWFRGSAEIPGATGPTLQVSNAGSADAGSYSVVVANGSSSATSAVATLTFAFDLLLAYDGFDYEAGTGNLPGKNGGTGWDGAWTAINGAGGNVIAGSLVSAGGTPAGYDQRSRGNHAFTPNEQRDGRSLNVAPNGPFALNGYLDANGNIGADGKTLFISFLQQPNGTSLFYEFEFHRDNLGDPGRIGGIGNDQPGDLVNLRTGGAQTAIGLGNSGVNFYVVRIDFKNGNDDVRVYRNPTSATEPVTPTLAKLGASDMSFDGISFGAWVNGRTVSHDEVRIGTSWASVFGKLSGPLTVTPLAILPNGHFQAGFSGVPGYTYSFEYSTNVTGPWFWLMNLTAGTDGLFQMEDSTEPRPATRFYRMSHP